MLVPLASRSLCQATLVSTESTLMVMVISTYETLQKMRLAQSQIIAKQGWQRDQPIGFIARYTGSNPESIIAKDLTQPTPYGALKIKGFPL